MQHAGRRERHEVEARRPQGRTRHGVDGPQEEEGEDVLHVVAVSSAEQENTSRGVCFRHAKRVRRGGKHIRLGVVIVLGQCFYHNGVVTVLCSQVGRTCGIFPRQDPACGTAVLRVSLHLLGWQKPSI